MSPKFMGLRYRGKWWEWELGLLPISGYTKFVYENSLSALAPEINGRDDRPQTYLELTPAFQFMVMAIGTTTTFLLGVGLLLITVLMGSRQLVVTSEAISRFRPVAISGLSQNSERATSVQQAIFVRDVAIYLTPRYAFIRPIESAGGWIGCIVTFATVGRESFAGWMTCVGALAILICCANLMPIPPMTGGKLIQNLGVGLFRRRLPERWEMSFTLIGFAIFLLLLLRICYADIVWIWRAIST